MYPDRTKIHLTNPYTWQTGVTALADLAVVLLVATAVPPVRR